MRKFFIAALFMVGAYTATAANNQVVTADDSKQEVKKEVKKEKEEFKFKGSPIVTIFANYSAGLFNMNEKSGFGLERAYFGYQAQVTKGLSAKVVFDIGSSKVTGSDLEFIAYIKNAQLTWKTGNFSLDFGLIGLKQFSTQEKFWGYRYLAKSFQDQYKFGTSADLGISGSYKFAKWLSADITIANGEGYKKLNIDNRNRYSAGVTVEPIKGLTVRGYYDLYSKNKTGEGFKDQQNLSFFAGYKHELFSVGAEYNMMYNTKFAEDKNQSGYSVYATVKLAKKFNIFGRFDELQSKDSWNKAKGDGNNIIAGIEYSPVKFLKLSPNFQSWKPSTGKAQSFVFMSLEFKL